MKRRKFILNTSMILSAIILPFGRIFGKEKTTPGIWHELLEYARWCPSPHNVQPWKVEIVSATQANLYYDPARFSSVVDETSAFTTVGMGMFVECLSIAAASRGMRVSEVHDAEEVMHADKDGIQYFAKLIIQP